MTTSGYQKFNEDNYHVDKFSKHGPLVGNSHQTEKTSTINSIDVLLNSIEERQANTTWAKVTRYTRLGIVFTWSLNQASIGQIAGNLTICAGNATNIIDNSLEVINLF